MTIFYCYLFNIMHKVYIYLCITVYDNAKTIQYCMYPLLYLVRSKYILYPES